VSGLVSTTGQVGGAFGLAVLATLSTSHSNALLNAGYSLPNALTDGYRLAFAAGAASMLAALALTFALSRPSRASLLDRPRAAAVHGQEIQR
jgi:hypothetical protein